jgi:hypothetical protein
MVGSKGTEGGGELGLEGGERVLMAVDATGGGGTIRGAELEMAAANATQDCTTGSRASADARPILSWSAVTQRSRSSDEAARM